MYSFDIVRTIIFWAGLWPILIRLNLLKSKHGIVGRFPLLNDPGYSGTLKIT